MACSAADVELKLFGCAIPFHAERSCEKGITLEEEEEEATTNAGIHIEESIRISNGGGGGGKAPKEGVSAAENTQPSHLLPEDGNGDGYGEEEIPTGGAAIISDDNNNNGNNRLMKKPEKHRPCPRCKSLNTKFCYFNNGNANQPRHFCRGCQRYWTAGGTLRNVPVGSGRRKSKVFSSSSSSTATASTTTTSLTHRHHHHHHHLPRPLANRIDGASARSGIADSAQYLPSQSTVLPTAVISRCLQMGCSIQDINKMSQSSSSYGAVTEDSMVTMMPMDEQSMVNGGEEGCWAMTNALNEQNGLSNGSSSGETNPPAPIDEYTYGSSEQVSTTWGWVGVGVGVAGRDFMGNSRPPFGFPVQPWPYGYGLFGFPPMLNYNQSSSLAPPLATPMLNYNRSSSLAPPLATWCAPPWMGGGGGVGGGGGGCLPWPLMMPAIPPWPHWGVPPWAVTTPMAGSYNNTPPCSSSSSSLDSGKHPGDGLLQQAATGKGGCLLNPKTLRTREPQEAAQSSIWSALGLDSNHYHDHDHDHNHNNNNNNSLVSASGIFERFPPKTNEKGGADGMWESHANLAART